MSDMRARFVGVELYFEDLERAKQFYLDTLGLRLSDEQPGHHAQFDAEAAFVCLEAKGSESYPSRDKAVLFFEVRDLRSAVTAIGPHRFLRSEPHWAVLHDRKDTIFCSSKPVEGDRDLRAAGALSCQFSTPMLSWRDSVRPSSPRGRHTPCYRMQPRC